MDCWSGAKILCDFWDTKINTDNIILTTRYRSEDIPGFVADPEEIKKYVHELVNNAHMAATDNKIRDTILINQKFDYLYAENGRLKAVVVDNNGEPQVTDVTPDKPYSQSLITDGQGDTLVVSKKGQVMGVKEYKFAGDDRHLLNEYHRQLDSLGEWQINFKKYDAQTYAFDQIGSGNHGIFATDEYYPKSGNYDFRYKSVECGQNDKVIVDYGSYPDRDSVIFKDKYGVKLKVVDGNILSFTGVSQPDTNYIYAYRGDKKIGKLFLNTYQRKIYNVVLVSVNEAKILHEKNVDKAVKKVEESLNKVYNQCAVSFKITHAAISIDDLTTFSHGGSGILSVYNEDQKKVLRAFDNQMTDGVYYLFFVDNVTDKKDGNGTPVSGYMPRGYNAGFIYDGGSPHTIAHELGHGIAGLEHVFENSNASGKTANLMDYATGEQLWHFQWDQIQDPSRVWMKWNKAESEGENVEGKFADYYLFSPWYAEKLFSQQDANILPLTKELKTQLYALTITPMSGDIKSTISQYKKHSDYPQVHLQNFTNYLQQASSLASCVNYIQNTSQYDGLHVWYLLPDGDGYKLTEKMLRAKDNQTDHVSRKTPYDWASFTKDWDKFWEEWLSVAMEDHQNGVFSISFSADANLYADENISTSVKEALSRFGDIKHISGNGGAYIEGGIAFDQWNVGIYGNLGVFLNGEIEKVSGMVKKLPTYTTYEKVKSMENYCLSISAGPSVNFSWFWNFDYLPELYGSGHTKSWTIGPVSGNLFYNRDDERGVFVSGLGFSLGSKAKIPVGFSSLSSENYGYIMTHKEFSDFITWLVKMQNYIEDKRDNPVPMFYIESKLNNSQYIKITKDAAKHYIKDIDEQK